MRLKSTLLFASALLLAGSSFGQYKVTTGGQKYTLLEEATGPGCGYCPDGAQDIEQSIDTMKHAVIASWHGAYYDGTSMVVTGDPFCNGTGYITGFPESTIDRYPFGGSAIGQSRPWEGYVSSRNALPPNFDVSMKCIYAHHLSTDTARADSAMVSLTVTVTAKALSAQTGTWNMNVFITEDSISSAPAGFQQHSYLNASTSACNGQPCWFTGLGSVLPAASYSHMNVVRAVLATGGSVFGDLALTNPAANATFSKTYTYNFDSTKFNPRYMKVIGLVQAPGPANTSTGNPIENVIEARVRWMPRSISATGVTEMEKAMIDVALYPNPAKNRVIVKGILSEPTETTIEIVNSIGQVVTTRKFPAGGSLFTESIDINELSNGNYFMNIINDGQKVTKSFVVSK